MQSALSPPDSAGKPQPISGAIEEIVTGEQTQQIREVTGAVKILLAVIAVLLGDRIALPGRQHDPALDLRATP